VLKNLIGGDKKNKLCEIIELFKVVTSTQKIEFCASFTATFFSIALS
jgi:hypothetical protein